VTGEYTYHYTNTDYTLILATLASQAKVDTIGLPTAVNSPKTEHSNQKKNSQRTFFFLTSSLQLMNNGKVQFRSDYNR
jgi:hypothetical protein